MAFFRKPKKATGVIESAVVPEEAEKNIEHIVLLSVEKVFMELFTNFHVGEADHSFIP